jgi:hypothetical protein
MTKTEKEKGMKEYQKTMDDIERVEKEISELKDDYFDERI